MSFDIDNSVRNDPEPLQISRDRDLRVRLLQMYLIFAGSILAGVLFLEPSPKTA